MDRRMINHSEIYIVPVVAKEKVDEIPSDLNQTLASVVQ